MSQSDRQLQSERPNTEADWERIEGEARSWFMRQQDDGQLTAEETQRFSQWMQHDVHRRSYEQLQNIWQGLQQLHSESPADIELQSVAANTSLGHRSAAGQRSVFHQCWAWLQSGWQAPLVSSAALVALLVSVVWLNQAYWTSQPTTQVYSTGIRESQTLTLDDGSVVTLGADSVLSIDFESARRLVELKKGQVFFDVAKDAQRPFFVSTSQATVKVVGTRFEVYQHSGRVKVSVEEGVVEVTHKPSQQRPAGTANTRLSDDQDGRAVLTAGQQVRANNRSLSEVVDLQGQQVAAWREGRLVYQDAPLAEVIADVNRYRDSEILLGTEPLKQVRITTSFRTDQVDSVISMLEKSLPVAVHQEADGRVLILPKTTTP